MTLYCKKRPLRSEVPVEMTWDLSDIYKNRDEWEQDYNKLQKEINELNVIKEHPFTKGKELYQYLELLNKFSLRISRVKSYTVLKEYEDYTNQICHGDKIKAVTLFAKYMSFLTTLETEIIYKSEAELAKLISEEPKLNIYKPYLTKIAKKKKHQLSYDTELALSKLYNLIKSPLNIYSKSKHSDLQFEPFLNDNNEELLNSLSLYEMNYELSSSYDIRGRSYQSLIKTLRKYENTYASTFATYVRTQIAISKIRNYESATHMMLDYQGTNVETYENQIKTVYTELAPHMQRFAKLKQKVLGIKKLRFCDLKASIAPKVDIDFNYDYAKKTIINALSILGDDYKNFIKTAFDKRWIDYGDNIGKMYSALCSTIISVHPYVLFTMQNSMRSITALAHELGHAGVSVYYDKDFIPLNTIHSLYLIEAPSTMDELLVGKYLIDNAKNSKMKILAILQLMTTYYHNFVTHLLEAEFLKRVFEHAEADKSITAKYLKDTKLEVLKGFWGDAVDIDDDAHLTWMRQGHYYGNLRPFIYSAGQTIATNIVMQIEEDRSAGVERWTNFLKSFEKVGADELLKIVKINMTKPEPIKKAVNYIGSLITELENLLL